MLLCRCSQHFFVDLEVPISCIGLPPSQSFTLSCIPVKHFMEFHDVSWNVMGFHEMFQDMSWNVMKLFMEIHGISWTSMEKMKSVMEVHGSP